MKNNIRILFRPVKRMFLFSVLFCLISFSAFSQEKYGTTVNLGVGIGGYAGYYHNVGVYVPVVHLDVEFDVVKNFTLAPFINFSSYSTSYFLYNPPREYVYRVSIIPVGVKGTYYFDELLHAGPKWDFYAAASAGFVFVNTSWSDPYYMDHGYYNGYYATHGNAPYLDLHIGTEYHITHKLGVYLDLSLNGVSTIGLAIH